ncbi:glycerophosphoryl diester phosphodiesterase membrane domain-containing protein [Aurantiacibacter sediminis]|uniref:Glycerophosphoryl diester phosphodiesterase membrane domain-containing protein n=1 Tax=Aurantiacibacter sediminis TaxID=2793064 RepID=A0ABS0N6Y6_9SPHN|nr:glycerophosphoryl diester phosphodiesterase membrane domain-containing protein [Aurantiacibacter sediminis]MBH5323530.1 glycerophosphoryl diester phosphodiesterase membrane domain-containing protein [Aurantiacibacter sediminis]
MPIKLDMGQAWNEAVAILTANKDVVAIVAGVFFFLPNAIATVMMPQSAELQAMAASGDPQDLQVLSDVMLDMYASIWWIFIPLIIMQAIGTLGLLALFTDSSRPTVGEALGFGAKGLLTYIAVSLISVVVLTAAFVIPVVFGAMIGTLGAALMGVVGLALMVYVLVKLSLTSPVIAIERQLNPLTAITRSWRITKGNSLRLFAFFVLLFLVLIVISAIASMFFTIFAIAGDEVGVFASAIGGALINMIGVVVLLAVMAAVHRQLTGGTPATVTDTFA